MCFPANADRRCLPDTEIDWRAYMEQVELYMAGERDYTKIRGGTGPLVYPAAHVYIYRALYSLTEGGTNIRAGQIIFAGLYLSTSALVMACYRLAKVRVMGCDCGTISDCSPRPRRIYFRS